ncbi:hypothetical protein G6N05_10420 [Flavobacterium sp. F372]|jgi:hypothetical protein|uniref:DUF4252 domain-containing protein n=1 Tax=Flavobacterium bernardetii TaxID=2813823 RepID=A0ABR7IYS6_9FLAO|nr:hypothetical protein [Flavobacterium bernardetii]MBC5834925.1 hypothetical protein [Flavobacterium bernardetii]NHF70522.1 hypothetical protein [Flavobacterium bernardetii]
MKNIFYFFILLINLNSFAQEVVECDFDANLSINILKNSEEGKNTTSKFVKGVFENEVIAFINFDFGKELVVKITENYPSKFFQTYKNDALKAANGKLISEEIVNINNIEILSIKLSFSLDDENKIAQHYIFVYKDIVYLLQFMNNENEFEKFLNFRKSIIDSIKFK